MGDDEKTLLQRTTVKTKAASDAKPIVLPEALPATEFQEFKVAPALVEQYHRRLELEREADALEADTLPFSPRSSVANDAEAGKDPVPASVEVSAAAPPNSVWAASAPVSTTIDTSGFPSAHAPTPSELSPATPKHGAIHVSSRRRTAAVVLAIGTVLGFAAFLVIKAWPSARTEDVSSSQPTTTASTAIEPVATMESIAPHPPEPSYAGASAHVGVSPRASASVDASPASRPKASTTPKAPAANPPPEGKKLDPDIF